jgi:hypothetical protein
MSQRDEFSDKIKTTLAVRVGYRCSNLERPNPTAGPHTDPLEATLTGEAAHIVTATPDGQRDAGGAGGSRDRSAG